MIRLFFIMLFWSILEFLNKHLDTIKAIGMCIIVALAVIGLGSIIHSLIK